MSQDSGDRETAENLAKEFNELNATLRLLMAERTSQNTNTQSFNLDGGSKMLWLAVWISTLCCTYMFGTTARMDDKVNDMQLRHLEDSRKLEADSDRLSILLQWAPALRDEVNREMQRRKGK